MAISKTRLDEIALKRSEYNMIVRQLGREPNSVELGMFGALWSEHCGYKHSKPLLKMFPTTGPSVQVEAGQENAGVVDIGDGLSVVFKVESHNHPSAVEPYQGAATGVGGIIRDIIAMGARPVALLNSLRFGPLDTARNRYLFEGVISGIAGYGNCIGIPDVGGEIYFSESYNENPLVNAMCVGLIAEGDLIRASASTPGNSLMLVGASTGRDGIHGASGLASRTLQGQQEMRPTVQVGDPFMEKVLMEACSEARDSGHLEGLQDLGAAGLTSSVIESAARGGTGVDLDVSMVPTREDGMTPYEIMLSESQERMLLIVKQGCENEITSIFAKWDLTVAKIGTVTDKRMGRVFNGQSLIANVPIDLLVSAPQYTPKGRRPMYLEELHTATMPPEPPKNHANSILRGLLGSPNIASKHPVYRQYDHEVQTNTVVKPGQGDAAVIRLRGSERALAVAVDGNGRIAYLEPYVGGAIAVAEACRNVACMGATPLAITDCLNFGNPERPEIYYQMKECIEGMAEACNALGIPVISGNVSLYNESETSAIYPTPVVGAVGLLAKAHSRITPNFKQEGDSVLLIGVSELNGADSALSGSEYLAHIHNQVIGKPAIDLGMEVRVQRFLIAASEQELLHSAHDCSDGGLAIALAESAILGNIGFTGKFNLQGRWDAALFGEDQSRVVISVPRHHLEGVHGLAQELGVPLLQIGTTGGDHFAVPNLLEGRLSELAACYFNGLQQSMVD